MAAHKIFFIVNPKAAHGKAFVWWQKFLPSLKQIHHETAWAYTYAHFSAALQAEEAIKEGYDVLVAIGGDGTAMEVLNGIITSGEAARVVMVPWPVGTGCDFARMLYQNTDCQTLIELLNHGHERVIDIMEAEYAASNGVWEKRVLFNVCNLGIAAIASDMVNHISAKRMGKLVFLYAAMKVISNYKGIALHICVDGMELPKQKYTVACFGNGAYIGGGMHACPQAEIDDGFLDILLADTMPTAKIFSFLPKFMKGNHLGLSGITYNKGQCITVDSPVPQLLDFDGEHPGFTPLKLKVLPNAVTVFSLEIKDKQNVAE